MGIQTITEPRLGIQKNGEIIEGVRVTLHVDSPRGGEAGGRMVEKGNRDEMFGRASVRAELGDEESSDSVVLTSVS